MGDCTGYCDDGEFPAQCPVCRGWLKWVYNKEDGEEQPICNKCHAKLVIIPDSESTEDYQFGKICEIKPFDNDNKTKGET